MTNDPNLDHAKRLIEASRTPTTNTLASWLREIAVHIDCLADVPMEGPDLPPHPYHVASGKVADLCRIAKAFTKKYPDDLRRDVLAALAGVLAVVEPIQEGRSIELDKITGIDTEAMHRETFSKARDRYAAKLQDMADRAAGHDLEHGAPKPPTPDGEFTAAELAEALKDKPKSKQGRPRESDPEADRKLAERWQAMAATTYADAAREIGIAEHKLRGAVERHRKRRD